MGYFDNLKSRFGSMNDEADAKLAQYGVKEPEPMKYATGEEITPMSLIDQITGAPMRTAVGEMQKGNFNKDMLQKTLGSMAQDPNLAPSGQDIAQNMGVDTSTGIGKAIGTGYELALDPTNFIPAKGPLMGLAAMGKVEDISRGSKAMKPLIKESKFGKIIQTGLNSEPEKLGKVITKVEPEAEKFGKALSKEIRPVDEVEKVARDNYVNKIMPVVREKNLQKEFQLAEQGDQIAMDKLTKAGIGRDTQKLFEDKQFILKNRK